MAKSILTDVRLFALGVDLTSASNKVELSSEVEEKDVTNYASGGYKEVLGGIASSTIQAEGQWEAGDATKVDDHSWSALGTVGPWTVVPTAATVGSLAYFTNALRCDYGLGASVGDVAPWSGKAAGSWPVARGQIAHPPGTARSSTGTGTGVQLGAVATGRRLYAALHVLSASGTTPSITVRVESDDNSGFTTPTTQATFTAATAAGGQIIRASGPITDNWWRVAWTISGTTPSFTFVAALGIAP
jgi:hypothetical protein